MQNILKHKGFIGSVECSMEDNILHGKILHINGLITYEAETPAELQNEFQCAVDDYIEFCEAQGVDPYKSFNGKFNVRISPELHKKATLLATKKEMTLNAFVTQAIENEIMASEREVSITYTYMQKQIVEMSKKVHATGFNLAKTVSYNRPINIVIDQTKVESHAKYQ